MKILLVVILLSAGFSTRAQDDKKAFPFNPFEQELRKTFIDKYPEQQYKNMVVSDGKHQLVNRPGIIRLPLDNMPCLVPDMEGFNMPVKKLRAAGIMPVAR